MDWARGATLGKGSFGTVSLAMILDEPTNPIGGGEEHRPQLMAVKSSDLAESASLWHEKHVLTHLAGCPHIVRCLGDDITGGENNRKFYNLFLEYVPGGTLDALRRRRISNVIEKAGVRAYTRSLLRGLVHIHRMGYVHCDIKLQNILVDEGDNIKIADFGLSKKVGEKVNCFRGTPVYMAPESVAGNEYEPPADIWSLGCAVFEMLTGKLAWGSLGEGHLDALLYHIGFGEELPHIPANLSQPERDFLNRCFVRDSRQRWTADMLLEHPFISAGEISPSSLVAAPQVQYQQGWISHAEEDIPVSKFKTEFETVGSNETSGGGNQGIREHSYNWLIQDCMMYVQGFREIDLVVEPKEEVSCKRRKLCCGINNSDGRGFNDGSFFHLVGDAF